MSKNDDDNDPDLTERLALLNAALVSHVPAYALQQTNLAVAQAQSVLLANMVQGQQHHCTASSAATMQSVKNLHGSNSADTSDTDRICEEIRRLAEAIAKKDTIQF